MLVFLSSGHFIFVFSLSGLHNRKFSWIFGHIIVVLTELHLTPRIWTETRNWQNAHFQKSHPPN